MATRNNDHNPKLAPKRRPQKGKANPPQQGARRQHKGTSSQTSKPSRPESVRLAAARACLEFDAGGVLRETPPPTLRKPEDRRLYMQLVRGVVRHKRLLEAQLEHLAGKPLANLDRELVWAGLLGLFQLNFLERIPPHAAVFETVTLATQLGKGRGKGFLNAILRRAQREAESGEWKPEALPLAVRTSYPDWMVDRWQKQYGDAVAENICRAGEQPGGVTLRAETGRLEVADLLERLAEEEIVARPHPLFSQAVLIDQAATAIHSRAFAEGLCYAQDVSSQILMTWARPLFEGRVLDACAAPGGKLTQIVRTPGLKLFGAEPSPTRLHRVKENIRRLRLPVTGLLLADGQHLPFAPTSLDGVILDVPCTATGIIRKYPEIKWRRAPGDAAKQAALQRKLLEEANRVVRPGGWVLYITCSLEAEENEDNVAGFLQDHPEYSRQHFQTLPAPAGLGEPANNFITKDGDFFCLPGMDRTALFATVLRKAP